jgi:hypothetical protein
MHYECYLKLSTLTSFILMAQKHRCMCQIAAILGTVYEENIHNLTHLTQTHAENALQCCQLQNTYPNF